MSNAGAKLMSLGRGTRGRWLAVAMLLGGAAGVGAWLWTRPGPAPTPDPVAPVAPMPLDPRLTSPAHYRNVRPDVAYVGSERCAGCHREIAAQYRQHPMGRSLAPLGDAAAPEKGTGPLNAKGPVPFSGWGKMAPKPWQPFDALGLHYRIEQRGDSLWHVESKQDAEGKEVAAQAEQVRYVMGSGTRGRSYLIERAGRLYQSPISWFTEEARWDLSPGYRTKPSHFTRAITEACLFCHANRVETLADTINRYRPPIFAGHAVGCERCHGPGDLHVRRHDQADPPDPPLQKRGAGGVPDDTIVQPRRLEPLVRDAVCEQCHLQGGQRVVRRGRSWFDYRPGLPLQAFVTTFVRQGADTQKSVGQVEQMAESRCYQQSRGQLGCISCHDSHRTPPPTAKIAYYRQRCLTCHDGGHHPLPPLLKGGPGGVRQIACQAPAAERQARGDSCIACHMPRTGSANVVHVSITDHRILRRPEAAPAAPKAGVELAPGETPLTVFHPPWPPLAKGGERGVGDDEPELERDLGIALANVALLAQKRNLAAQALPRLRLATRRDPRDLDAWHAYANALMVLQQPDDALAAADAVLAWAPKNEMSLYQAASSAMAARKIDRALEYWQRLIALNPEAASFHAGLTNAHALRGEWPQAAAAAEASARLNPTQPEPRISLIQALLQQGQRERAEREFEILRRMQPPNLEQVRRWFAK